MGENLDRDKLYSFMILLFRCHLRIILHLHYSLKSFCLYIIIFLLAKKISLIDRQRILMFYIIFHLKRKNVHKHLDISPRGKKSL